jgi:D-3-phosphoglycerate dehydrogenase
MTTQLSQPFSKKDIKVVLLEDVHQTAIDAFTQEGYQVHTLPDSLTGKELVTAIRQAHVVGIRSGTKLTSEVLEHTPKLLAIGAFCVGTNQINVAAAASRGIAIFNAPYANSRSVVELAIGEMIMLMRRTFERSNQTHAGEWHKSAIGSYEIRGKTLGIIGYGNIGKQLSVIAEALGMKVLYHDIQAVLTMGNAQSTSLRRLLTTADIVTIHVDGRAANANLIGHEQLACMKPTAILLNLSRGHVVDQQALAQAIRDRRLAGAAVDVYPDEPDKGGRLTSPLQDLPNVILTPHIGGSTQEAQAAIGSFVSSKITSFINTGDTSLSVNLPNVSLPAQHKCHRLLHIHSNVPGVLAKVNSVLADRGANTVGQYLATAGDIGYCIIDTDQAHGPEVKAALAKLPETIKLRLLY